MLQLHPELKILKAELIRLNFEKYLISESFKLLMLEKDIDDLFNKVLATARKNSINNEKRINTYLLILNDFMNKWIREGKTSNASNTYYNYFLFFTKTIIKGYFTSQKQVYNYENIIICLRKITMLNEQDINDFEKELEDQKKIDMKMIEDYTNKSEINQKGLHSIDYAIITALEEDEMEKVLPFINKIQEVEASKNLIEIGEFKNNSEKKIVYASQHNTGMVDAAVLASELILNFNPRYLIMVGVLGGKPTDINIGDVVVATKVFEIDRGKITETGFKKETSVANITNKEIKKISRAKKHIESFLNNSDHTRNSEVKLHFGPIACVNQVIDLEDFFKDKITNIDRKAIALEMESFAIIRACELLNNSKTTPIIIKSVMDNTQEKTDSAKSYAAWTSAKTLEYLLTNNII